MGDVYHIGKRRETTLRAKNWKPANLPSPKGVNPLEQKKRLGKSSQKRNLRDPKPQERTQKNIQPLGAPDKANPQGRKKAQKESREEFEGVEVKLPSWGNEDLPSNKKPEPF